MGTDGAQGAPGPAGTDGVTAVANVQCTGSYTSGEATVFVSVGYTSFSNGIASGICSVTRRGDRVVDVAYYSGGLCFLTDWSSLDPRGGADVDGVPLALALIVDPDGSIVRTYGETGLVDVTALTCDFFDPETGDFL
jgi:hypothetical protein